MEYATLITAGTRWLTPADTNGPEGVVIHETGHQFWQGMVATNEFEHAWMDEGLNTYDLGFGDQDYKFRLPARVKTCSRWGLYPL